MHNENLEPTKYVLSVITEVAYLEIPTRDAICAFQKRVVGGTQMVNVIQRTLINLWRSLCQVGSFVHRNDYTVNWIFRSLALAGFMFLILDRMYDMQATISTTGSDPNNALAYPFALTNNSRYLAISDVKWQCNVVKLISKSGSMIDGALIHSQSPSRIPPGKTANITCSSSMYIDGPHVAGLILISVSYRMLFMTFEVKDVPFRWSGRTSNPQWVRGNFANPHALQQE